MKVIFRSDKGLVREVNQDWVEIRNFKDESCLAVVCDGIGGVAGGEVASKAAAIEVCNYFEKNSESEIKYRILESIKSANERILQIAHSNNKIADLGTTCVVAFFKKGNLCVASVGDSRAYLISESKIEQITCDHSVVNELLAQGKITSDEAKCSKNKNIITRALGYYNAVPDYYEISINAGDKILVCTDGLTNCLTDSKIYEILNKNTPERAVDLMVDAANNNGGTDNITVALIF